MPTTCQVLGEPSRWGFCEVVVGLFPLRKKVFLATAGLLLFTLSLFFSSSILFFSPIALTPSLDLTLVNLFPGRQAQTGKDLYLEKIFICLFLLPWIWTLLGKADAVRCFGDPSYMTRVEQ